MSEFDDALQALDDAIYLFTKPGGGHTDTGKRLIAAKAEFKACRQALVTATLEQSGAIFQVQKLQAELLNHRHGAGDGEDSRAALGLLSRMRFACGDNGLRMQDELEEYLRGLAGDAARFAWWFSRGDETTSQLIDMHIESLNGKHPTLDQWRAAIDAAMHAPGGAGGGE